MNTTVVICTYNPREDHLRRTLQGLRDQTLPRDRWSFLLVDNNSEPPLEGRIDLSWHPDAKVVVETRQGLTPARIRAIEDTSSELLVFVDDDNVLDPDYLAEAVRIAGENPDLGCFGATALVPEFEEEPKGDLMNFTGYLAVREDAPPSVSADALDSTSSPWGAGLCVRRCVADGFARRVRGDAQLEGLGRRGMELLSGEDLLFSWISVDQKMRKGIFETLKLKHLISPDRVTRDYLLRISSGQSYSGTILLASQGYEAAARKGSGILSLCKRLTRKARTAGWATNAAFSWHRWKARRAALRDLGLR